MRVLLLTIVATGLVTPQYATGTSTFRVWRSSELRSAVDDLRRQIPGSGQNFAIKDLDTFGKHQVRFYHLTGNGNPEMHETKVVVYVVRDGEATVLNGGRLLDPTPRSDDPRRWRGSGIEGARTFSVHAGDVFEFPAGEAHQIQVAPGHSLTALGFVVDVQ